MTIVCIYGLTTVNKARDPKTQLCILVYQNITEMVIKWIMWYKEEEASSPKEVLKQTI